MKKKISLILLFLLIGAVACGGKNTKKDNTPTKDDMWGEEEGYATIFDGDTALARDRAIDDAMNKLVKVKLGMTISGKSLVEDFQLVESVIEAKTSGMVKDWKVVNEKKDGDTFIVRVAGRVYPQAVDETIRATIENYGRPKFMVLVKENFEGKTNAIGSTVAEHEMMNIMGKAGFEFVDAETVKGLVAKESAKMNSVLKGQISADGDAQELLTDTGAEVIILGDIKVNDQTEVLKKKFPNSSMKSKSATIVLKAIDVYTGAILASVAFNGVGAHISDDVASQQAVQRALASSKALGEDGKTGAFINDIGKKFLAAATRRMIKLNIAGLDYADLAKFRNAIEQRVRGVSKVYSRGTSGKLAVIEIQFAGKTTDFADELSAKADKFGFAVKIEQSFPTKLIISAAKNK
ncbi:MAG TPA: DUF6175 family protein [Spirochaetota bacterium]|nr:DUF6175 family protein [Spirochaetota bacterium]